MFEAKEKFCKDCVYYAESGKATDIQKFDALCTHPSAAQVNLVTGESEPTQCRWMRYGTRCDSEGKLFEPKQEAAAA